MPQNNSLLATALDTLLRQQAVPGFGSTLPLTFAPQPGGVVGNQFLGGGLAPQDVLSAILRENGIGLGGGSFKDLLLGPVRLNPESTLPGGSVAVKSTGQVPVVQQKQVLRAPAGTVQPPVAAPAPLRIPVQVPQAALPSPLTQLTAAPPPIQPQPQAAAQAAPVPTVSPQLAQTNKVKKLADLLAPSPALSSQVIASIQPTIQQNLAGITGQTPAAVQPAPLSAHRIGDIVTVNGRQLKVVTVDAQGRATGLAPFGEPVGRAAFGGGR